MKTYSGITLIGVAVMMLAMNLSDTIADLKNWHEATTPLFVAAVFKQAGSVLVAALGGNLVPTMGTKKETTT